MNKTGFDIDNLQWLMYHKTNQTNVPLSLSLSLSLSPQDSAISFNFTKTQLYGGNDDFIVMVKIPVKGWMLIFSVNIIPIFFFVYLFNFFMIFDVGNGHGDTSSNPGRDCISHSTNTIGKGINPINPCLAMGK